MNRENRHTPVGWMRYGEPTFRSAVAGDRRLRRKAASFGLAIKKRRGAGGCVITDPVEGQLGEALFDWQAFDLLHCLTRPESIHDWFRSAAIARVRRRIAREARA